MRIAILSPYPTFPFAERLGGVPSHTGNATWTVTLAKHLAELPDTEIHIVTEATGIPRSQQFVSDNVVMHFLRAPSYGKQLTFYHFDRQRLHRELQDLRPDIVHGQGLENQYGYAAVTCQYPSLLTIHGVPHVAQVPLGIHRSWRGWITRRLELICLRRARNIVVINPYVQHVYGLSSERYQLFAIPNAIHADFFTTRVRARAPDLVLAVGSVDRRKGHDVLVQALSLLKQRGSHPRTVIAGPPAQLDYFATLQQMARDAGLGVQFPGFLPPDRVRTLMQTCTMLVLPSRHETAPMVVAEAMALGTPVIAANVAGLPHMIRDGVNGCLVPPADATALADKIQWLLGNPEALRQFGEAGRQYALANHHPQQVARLTRASYERILHPSADRP